MAHLMKDHRFLVVVSEPGEQGCHIGQVLLVIAALEIHPDHLFAATERALRGRGVFVIDEDSWCSIKIPVDRMVFRSDFLDIVAERINNHLIELSS